MTLDNIFETAGWIGLRAGMGFVYLFALYKNVEDAAARQWLVVHSAYVLPPSVGEPRRTQLARVLAFLGAAVMLIGGLLIVVGVEARIGALMLLVFTATGIYQHKKECDVATTLGQNLLRQVPDSAKAELTALQWSGYSGNFSSGLKNWALCGVCLAIFCWGSGPIVGHHQPGRYAITLSDWIVPSILHLHQ